MRHQTAKCWAIMQFSTSTRCLPQRLSASHSQPFSRRDTYTLDFGRPLFESSSLHSFFSSYTLVRLFQVPTFFRKSIHQNALLSRRRWPRCLHHRFDYYHCHRRGYRHLMCANSHQLPLQINLRLRCWRLGQLGPGHVHLDSCRPIMGQLGW